MFYFVKKWWNKNAWKIIFFGGLIIIIILWIFYAGNENKSSSTNLNDAINVMLSPTEKSPKIKNYPMINSPSNYSRTESQTSEKRSSKGENMCRKVMEELTGKPFKNVRPKWLMNPVTHQPLELDCYNEELRIAIEYNGKQHYEYNKYMHQNSKDKFYNQQYRDIIKQDLCKKNNVVLITVPYNVPEHKIKSFLFKALKDKI